MELSPHRQKKAALGERAAVAEDRIQARSGISPTPFRIRRGR